MILYVAIGGLFAFLGGMVWFSTLDFPELEKSELELLSVDVVEIDSIDNRITLNIIFGVTNFGERTVTVPEISYELFANGRSLGSSSYSVSDIPMTGRALLISGMQVVLESKMTINLTDDIEHVYKSIANGESVGYRVNGQYTIETAWQVLDIQFDSSI
tara:strand:+ start:64 stop:540 length:477 start_codon:yes stop_codon:yes gene_type:complete